MRDMLLLMKQSKNFYLTILAFLAILVVRGTLFIQTVEVDGMDVYMFMVCVMLLPFSMGFMGKDNRNKEFEEKLPIKKVTLEMSGYLAMICIGMICFLLSVLTTAVSGRKVKMAANEFSCLVLGVWATMTFFYLFAMLFKKFIVGFLIAFVYWLVITVYIWQNVYTMYEEGLYEISYMTYAALLGVTMLMMIAMIMHSKYRELSTGKICYFKWIEVIMLILIAAIEVMIGVYMLELPVIIALMFAVLAVYVIYRSLYYKEKHVFKLEVSEQKQYKNPLLSYRLRYCIIFGAILTLVLVATSMINMKERSREFESAVEALMTYEGDIYIFSADELKEIKNDQTDLFFDVHVTETFFMIVACSVWFFTHFAAEGKKAEKEFFEALPLSRRQKYRTTTGMGVVTLIVPFILEAIANLRYYGLYLKYCNSSELAVAQEAQIYGVHVKYSVLWPLMLGGFTLAIIGVSKLIDAVIENEILKVLTLLFTYVVGIGILPVDYYLVQTELDKIENTIPKAALAGIVLGIVFIIAAGKLYEMRDNTRSFFYFKSALYIYSAIASIIYASLVLSLSQGVWGYILAVCGVILVYVSCIHFLGGKAWNVK